MTQPHRKVRPFDRIDHDAPMRYSGRIDGSRFAFAFGANEFHLPVVSTGRNNFGDFAQLQPAEYPQAHGFRLIVAPELDELEPGVCGCQIRLER